MTTAVIPFIKACNSIPGLKNTGTHISTIFNSIRTIIELGTKCKKPSNVQASIMPFLKTTQDAMASIRQARLDRTFDWHIKAIMEMLTCVSWVIMTAPPAPSTFIKDTIGASDFWANKIRKEYKDKGKDEKIVMIAFCDTLKALIMDLSVYVKEYHLSGLMWNPRGMALEEYESSSLSTTTVDATVNGTAKASVDATVEPASVVTSKKSMPSTGDVMKELAAKRTSDGTSAATGLKKVSRDQQTWRKEFKTDTPKVSVVTNASARSALKPSAIKAGQKVAVVGAKKKLGVPVCKFLPVGSKWIVEYQTKESNPNGLCMIQVKDAKEQIYM